ncbi:FAD-dependent monooxygenase [Amycolatopsis sp. NPDC051128]|uniref:FAD-dependent monooxygenase n=1 Tax=Amycolatopsis sp. NPDC051128 TaxID=3155412 RepID=UPI00342E6366
MTEDVLIVGAGPVGLTLACLLRQAGLRPLVLEALAAPDGVTKVGSIGPHAVEVLARCGVHGDLVAAEQENLRGYARMTGGSAVPGGKQVRGEHFAGAPGIDVSHHTTDRHRRMLVEQPILVSILLKRAAQLGFSPRWQHEVVEAGQDGSEAFVIARTPAGPRRITARYVIGADGPRSAVRGLAGFPFEGTGPTLTARQALVELDPDGAVPPPGFHAMEGGMLAYGTAIDSLGTFEFDGPPTTSEPLTAAELQASVDRVRGPGVRIRSIREGSRYTDVARQAATYRSGRILLVGDSAHVHPPIGAQGLTLGLGDAANLAAKLTARLLGRLPDGILDTYTGERHPVAARLLAMIRAQVALMRPDSHNRALRRMFLRLMELPQVNDHLARFAGAFDLRYDVGGDDPLLGTFRSGLDTSVATRDGSVPLATLLGGRRGVLVGFPGARPLPGAVAAAEPWADVTAALLRPDGCVVWLSRTADAHGLAAAGRRWLGR